MAESQGDRTNILAAIQAALVGVTTPTLSVVQGMPWSINKDRSCFWWYAGDSDDALFGPHTLSERAVVEKFLINVFWLPPQAQQLHTAMVAEAWNANRSIQQALGAHTTLGQGAVAMVHFEPSKAGLWQHFSGSTYYALEIEAHLSIPSAESEAQ